MTNYVSELVRKTVDTLAWIKDRVMTRHARRDIRNRLDEGARKLDSTLRDDFIRWRDLYQDGSIETLKLDVSLKLAQMDATVRPRNDSIDVVLTRALERDSVSLLLANVRELVPDSCVSDKKAGTVCIA